MRHDDHRAIARRMELFHLQEEGPGMVFWHPNGFALFRIVEDYVRARMRAAGFREIRTPQLLDSALWQASGHLEKFRHSMFLVDGGERRLALKPMSCPGHVQVFNSRLRSFRELPLRYAEFGHCLRNEASGGLLGLMRTRAFVQDDAHIFCLEHQVEAEVAAFAALLDRVYRDFGFAEVSVFLAGRPAERAGSESQWDRAEALLGAAAAAAGLDIAAKPGEGAFYGPKLELRLHDSAGRQWQCGTIQLDFVLPERLDASFVDAAGARARPVMLHQAVLGSLERFIGVLLEHYCGNLPLWLAPEQIVLAPLGADQRDYAREVEALLVGAGYRVRLDDRPERLAKKIVDARAAGVPLLLVLGPDEAARRAVTLRRRDGSGETLALESLDGRLRGEAFK